MPHVIVKFHPGRTDAEKRAMADAIASALERTMGYDIDFISVAVEEIEPSAWMSSVYEPEIAGQVDRLVRRPRYGSLA